MYIQKKSRKVTAAEDIDVEDVEDVAEDVEDVEDVAVDVEEDDDVETEVAPGAADILFEADDVAQLVAEVTGQPVEVDADEEGSVVTFSVGEDVFTVEPEGDEEVLESCGRKMRDKKPVKASKAVKKNVTASRVVRRIAKKK